MIDGFDNSIKKIYRLASDSIFIISWIIGYYTVTILIWAMLNVLKLMYVLTKLEIKKIFYMYGYLWQKKKLNMLFICFLILSSNLDKTCLNLEASNIYIPIYSILYWGKIIGCIDYEYGHGGESGGGLNPLNLTPQVIIKYSINYYFIFSQVFIYLSTTSSLFQYLPISHILLLDTYLNFFLPIFPYQTI